MKVLGFIIACIITVTLGFVIEASIAEVLHLIFPSLLSFWKWLGLVFVASIFLGRFRASKSDD